MFWGKAVKCICVVLSFLQHLDDLISCSLFVTSATFVKLVLFLSLIMARFLFHSPFWLSICL